MSSLSGPEIVHDAYLEMLSGEYRSIPYSNLQLDVDGYSSVRDPDMLAEGLVVAVYWSAGIPGTRHEYAAVALNMDQINPHDERVEIRETILGAKIGPEAQARYEASEARSVAQEYRMLSGAMHIPALKAFCESAAAPYSLVAVAEVVESEVIPVGERVAHLFFPVLVPPRDALKRIRQAVRGVIQEETL